MAVTLAAAAVAAPAPAFVQVNSATPQTNQSSVGVTYTGAQTAGNTNIVVIGWSNATSNITSVTDSAGNTYKLAVPTARGNGLSQAIYYAPNIKATAPGTNNTVTATFNTATPYVDVRALEYSGLDPNTPFDVGTSASGTGASANSGTVTTTSANELIFGAGTTSGGFTTPGTNFTTRIITNPDADIAADRFVTSTGTYNATAQDRYSSANWVMQVATFKTATAPSGDTTPPTAAITAPANGATVSGTVTLTANATDNVGVAGVQFLVDDNPLGAQDTTPPYSVSWDTTTATNGTHTLTALATDTSGNTGLSAPVTVTVANAVTTAPPAFVQVNSATPQTNQSSVGVTYTGAQTAGNTNIVVIGWNNATSNITSVTDTAGNTYKLAVPTARGTGVSQAIYYAPNIKATAPGTNNTVTATFNTATPYVDVRALEYSGLDPNSPVRRRHLRLGHRRLGQQRHGHHHQRQRADLRGRHHLRRLHHRRRQLHHPHHHHPRRRHRRRPVRVLRRYLQRNRTGPVQLRQLGHAGRHLQSRISGTATSWIHTYHSRVGPHLTDGFPVPAGRSNPYRPKRRSDPGSQPEWPAAEHTADHAGDRRNRDARAARYRGGSELRERTGNDYVYALRTLAPDAAGNTYEELSRITVTDPTAAVLTADPNSEQVLVLGNQPGTARPFRRWARFRPRRQALRVNWRQHLLHHDRQQQCTKSYQHIRQGSAP